MTLYVTAVCDVIKMAEGHNVVGGQGRSCLTELMQTLSVIETYRKPPSIEVLTVFQFLVISQCLFLW